jgi:uncharacterized OB-fold protein
MSTPSFPRPLPRVEGDAAPFWKALAAHRIELPRCTACGTLIFYPRTFCTRCHSRDVRWEEISGVGRVYTFSVVHRATHPWFMDKTPYVYAIVELEAGVRLPTMLIGCAPEDVSVGMSVEPVFDRASDEVVLLHFRPRSA